MKTYKGYELIKAIAEGNIKDGNEFTIKNFTSSNKIYFNGNDLYYVHNGEPVFDTMYLTNFLNYTYELIEEQQDIDIQAIKKFIIPEIAKSEESDMWVNRITINELIQAVKQLDRKIREEK